MRDKPDEEKVLNEYQFEINETNNGCSKWNDRKREGTEFGIKNGVKQS